MRRFASATGAAIVLWALAVSAQGASAAAPTILTTPVSGATTTEITLEAVINPQGKATKYHFAYGPADCSSNPCPTTHVTELKAGTTPVTVSAPIEGLEPGTTYHFQAFAENKDQEGAQSPDRSFMTYLAPQQFGPCPNDALRLHNPAAGKIEYSAANLPDCRAYEQASPVNKGGGDASGTAPFVRAANRGGAVSFLSLSGTPGGLGSQEFPPFLAARSGEGWAANGLLPPAGFGQQAKVLGWSPDFSQVYTQATTLGEPPLTTLLVAGPGGVPQTIAPYTPPLKLTDPVRFDFAGASEDGGEVLFESEAAIAGVPGTIAGHRNLYLWDRASDTLHLAGVMNDNTAPAKGAFAGPYGWINGTTPKTLSEGGAIQRYYLEDLHAISADGAAVYFTAAGTGQLYARLNPAQPQSATDGSGKCTEAAKACTVNLSASKRTIPDPAGNRPAAFMGASADGTKSIFTSTQMLTDDANTGPEQEAAAIERSDLEGKPESIDPSLLPVHAGGIAVSGDYIYWADPSQSTIGRARLDGTQREEFFIETGSGSPKSVAVDASHIYWTNDAEGETPETFPAPKEGTIGRAKLNGEGGATEVTPDLITGASAPQGIAVDSAHVYWSNANAVRTINPGAGSRAIGRAKLDGTEADQEFIVTGPNESPWDLAVDASHIYWTVTNPNAFLMRADLGGSFETLRFLGGSLEESEEIEPRGIAVDASHVYWAAQGTDAIGRADLDLTPASVEEEFIPGAGGGLIGITSDAAHLYWSSNGESPPNPGNDLYQYDSTKPLAGRLSDLAPDHSDPDGIDIRGVLGTSADGSYVYFAANGVPDGLTGSPNPRDETAEPGDCKGILHQFAMSGICDLYLAHDGSVRFITRLDISKNELETDAMNWASTPKGIFPNSALQKTSRVTPDGRALLFRSQRQLSDYPSEGTSELYLYRADTADLVCVSCNPTGVRPEPVGLATLGSITTPAVIPTPPASTLTHNLSADGNRVFFETTDALVSTDTNGEAGCPRIGTSLQQFPACADTYEWEAQGSGSCEAAEAVADGGCVYLISTGKGTEPQLIADASADGSEVFFFTRSRLVGSDEDNLMDVYDARVNGGISTQNQPPSPPRCEAEGCKPQASAPPQVQSPAAITGPENPPIKRPRCKKPKHLVKGHCRGARHHRRANGVGR
jgi:sugar lactone lactonase YvrE